MASVITAIIDLVKEHNLEDIVATNTSTRRSELKTKILPQTGQLIEEEAG